MEFISTEARQYLLHRRLARRWIRDGGVLIAAGSARAGSRSTFHLVETVLSGATLQVTFNLREVSKACRFLNDYAVYLWDCDQEGEYLLCGAADTDAFNVAASPAAKPAPPFRRVPATCYAGRIPRFNLDIYDSHASEPPATRAAIMTRLLLPRGLCAAIYQNPSSERGVKQGATPNSRFSQEPRTIAQDA